MQKSAVITETSKDYELLDSGDGEKLERFGEVVLRRPDPQVIWEKALEASQWDLASARFDKQWSGRNKTPSSWNIEIDGKSFKLKLSAFKHVGIFPEQRGNWSWIEEITSRHSKPIKILNLFGYTGGATLAALIGGAEVTHVDGSKTAITWAKENAQLSGLSEKPVRWILDDAMAFVKREIKRGNKYDGIIMDPPAFGHGPDGEEWKIEKNLPELVSLLSSIISPKASFILINGYASGYSQIAYSNLLEPIWGKRGGEIQSGEMAIQESSAKRLLPAGIFVRWIGSQ